MPSSAEDLDALARQKLTRVLGTERGQLVYRRVAESLRLDAIRTAQDLYDFGRRLSAEGGMENAVAGILTVAAVLRGARTESE